jgi:hypothetical protein
MSHPESGRWGIAATLQRQPAARHLPVQVMLTDALHGRESRGPAVAPEP